MIRVTIGADTPLELSNFSSAQNGQFYTVAGQNSYGDRSFRNYIYDPNSIAIIDGDNVLAATAMLGVGRFLKIKSEDARKKSESFNGVSSNAGQFTVLYAIPYLNIPVVTAEVLFNPVAGVNNPDRITHFHKVTDSSTIGFTITTYNVLNVVGLLPSYPVQGGVRLSVRVTEY